MKRRDFLGFGLTALVASLPLSAIDFRKEKPNAWTEKNVYDGDKPTMKGIEAAIKDLYGDVKVEDSADVKLKPKSTNSGAQLPIQFGTTIPAKTIALFQDVNPECLVAVYEINDNMVADYFIKIKMKQSGNVVVVVEGKDGKSYKAQASVNVPLGGCEG